MRHRFRPRPSYANVTATLALVLAIGGTSYAAVTINGKNIKNRTIAGKKLKKNTVTGAEVRESKLGKVRSATQADNAATADTAAGATNAANATKLGGATPESYRVACPGGTIRVLDECFEPNLRAATTLPLALKACGAAGRRVPTFPELEAARQNGLTTGSGSDYELTATMYEPAVNDDEVLAIDAAGNRFQGAYATFSKQYRCVAVPTNAG
jgi:subtilisin family serine protease